MLRKRIITALWSIPLVVIAVWFTVPVNWFSVLAFIAGGLAIFEFYRLTGVLKYLPLAIVGIVCTLFFILYPHFNFSLSLSLIAVFVITVIILMMFFMRWFPRWEQLFRNLTWSLTGIIYIGWLISFLVALRLEAGRDWVYLALFATFGSDTLAYFIGKTLGKYKMAPSISPNKTWEGAAGGLLGAVIISFLFTLDTPLKLPVNYLQAIVLGIIISIFGQIGDLTESLLKRRMAVKDSSSLMPGHGGLLDRLDSILFAGIVVYLYYSFIVI